MLQTQQAKERKELDEFQASHEEGKKRLKMLQTQQAKDRKELASLRDAIRCNAEQEMDAQVQEPQLRNLLNSAV